MTQAEKDVLRTQLVIINQASAAALSMLAKDDPDVLDSPGEDGMPPLLGQNRPSGPRKE